AEARLGRVLDHPARHGHIIRPLLLPGFAVLGIHWHAPPPPQIYTLSLHDALPISPSRRRPIPARPRRHRRCCRSRQRGGPARRRDRKSTRLNSSHLVISYAVFCLKKKEFLVLGSTDRITIGSQTAH